MRAGALSFFTHPCISSTFAWSLLRILSSSYQGKSFSWALDQLPSKLFQHCVQQSLVFLVSSTFPSYPLEWTYAQVSATLTSKNEKRVKYKNQILPNNHLIISLIGCILYKTCHFCQSFTHILGCIGEQYRHKTYVQKSESLATTPSLSFISEPSF